MKTAPTTRSSHYESGISASKQKVTVVHSGARDAYQVSLAFEEAGMLDSLVTDLFWPADRRWARSVMALLPHGLRRLLNARSEVGIPSSKVRLIAFDGAITFLLEKLATACFISRGLRRERMRRADAALGRAAGQHAQQKNTALLSYSYYAHDAFAEFRGLRILFQMHPHPASMRRILMAELMAHPQCASSLQQEWELALSQADFERLASEPLSARHVITASSFTRSTLEENGIPLENITVIPYGVDSKAFVPDPSRQSSANHKLRLLFVGRINQRKGIQYLLDSIGSLKTGKIELTVCGHVVDDLAIFRGFGDSVKIRANVSRPELVAAYQSADLFVFPSVAEGFGQVLLESLACGLPILTTTRTAAPDLIESGREGFIIEPGKSAPIAERLEWALTNRNTLRSMRSEARFTAEQFPWSRFRKTLAVAVAGYLEQGQVSPHTYARDLAEGSILHAL